MKCKKKIFTCVSMLMLSVILFGGVPLDSKACENANDINQVSVISYDNDTSTEESTEEPENGVSGNLNDFFVHMNDDGTISTSMDDNGDSTSFWQWIFDHGKQIVLGISGVATIIFAGMMVFNFWGIATSGGNANDRSRHIKALVWTIVATAACGSLFGILAMAWNFFR